MRPSVECGNCWSYSGVFTLETQYAIRNNVTAPIFSEPNAVDCAIGNGCSGGTPYAVWDMAKAQKGMATRAGYPSIVSIN